MIFISFGSHPRSAVLKFVTLFADAKFLRGFYSFGNVFRRERLQQTAGSGQKLETKVHPKVHGYLLGPSPS